MKAKETRPKNCVRFHEMVDPYIIGMVHPGEDDEQEIWWDMKTGNLYVECRDFDFENSIDSFGIRNGRRTCDEWFWKFGFYGGNDRMEAQIEMERCLENAELV